MWLHFSSLIMFRAQIEHKSNACGLTWRDIFQPLDHFSGVWLFFFLHHKSANVHCGNKHVADALFIKARGS